MVQHSSSWEPPDAALAPTPGRLVVPPLALDPRDEEHPHLWGFADTRFQFTANGAIQLTGSRYSLCGEPLEDLRPWMSEAIGVALDPRDVRAPNWPPQVPTPRQHPAFHGDLSRLLRTDQWSDEPLARLRRGHGHTVEDIWALKYGHVERVPDLVVWPESEADVDGLVTLAERHRVSLVPVGGGTNVTNALTPPRDDERLVVAVDMRRMNRIRWIDPTNQMACVEAGAVGRHLAAQLAQYGFTMGHEPDSIEFSTLGGWIATHASGMKKNRYGNIEDLVLGVTAITPMGRVEHGPLAPRESAGPDPRRWLLGSEGTLGIVTHAVIRIFPLPEVQRYASVALRDFHSGVAFLHDLQRRGPVPASVRLVDNEQFRFALALKPRPHGLARLRSRAQRFLVTRVLHFDAWRMCACTIVYEGTAREVAAQERAVGQLAKRHGGIAAGAENGRRGYELTFGIAYIRDFVMDHWILAESFETSVTWDRVESLVDGVKERVRREHADRGLPGQPFITARVTQVYPSGVAVYFYLAIYYKGVAEPIETYAALEGAARDEILRRGGSLSHHHGVGKLRQRFLPRVASPGLLEAQRRLKYAVDPHNVLGSGNLVSGDHLARD